MRLPLFASMLALACPLVSSLSLAQENIPMNALATAAPLTLERVFADPPLLGTAPRLLKIAPDGGHVSWLQPRDTDQLRFDLWVEEIATGKRRMLVDSKALSAAPAQLSEAELQRRERARLMSARGITEYQWAPDGRQLLVPLDGDLWLAPLNGPPIRLTDSGSTDLDAKVSPMGHYVSFVRDQNLWLAKIAGGKVHPLTTAGGGLISYGMAEFVAQEEMDRMTGQWWAPDDSRIALARVDETPVKVAVRSAIGSDGTQISEQRYPFAGTPNAVVTLEIHLPTGGAPVKVDLSPDPDIYLARVNWLNPRQLLVQRQTRDQKRLDLLLVEADTGASRVLLSEVSKSWLNLHDSLRVLADGKRFIWKSARSGHEHLYLWDGKALQSITHGPWSVSELVAVDEAAGTLLFSGFRETALEKSLYRVPIAGGEITRLTPGGGWVETVADNRGQTLLLTRSTPETPPSTILAALSPGGIEMKREVSSNEFPYALMMENHVVPIFGTVKTADGRTDLHYKLMLPKNLAEGQRVPVFFEVYGGPGVRRVTRQFGSMLHQYLVQQGWAVFQLENRGTPDRGTAFESVIHHNLGGPEVEDQLQGLRWLKAHPNIDPGRIAVYGWSYGGYMVQRLMTEHPEAFAAGVSGAPVTDWKLYDTHYTERYLGNPATDDAPYVASDVTLKADRLARPLLMIHGLADDNVVFDHSARMMAALQKAGRPFEVMVYPGQTHGIRDPQLATHQWNTILSFLNRTVRAPEKLP